MSTPASSNRHQALYDYGYEPIPLIPVGARLSASSKIDPNNLGKIPGEKGPDGWAGRRNFTTRDSTESDRAKWHRDGAHNGARLGRQRDGAFLNVIDVDIDDVQQAAAVGVLIERNFGQLCKRVGKPPRASYPFRTAELINIPKISVPAADGSMGAVEILSGRRQFVVDAVHPKTGQRFNWERPLKPLNELPILGPDRLQAFVDEVVALFPGASVKTGSVQVGDGCGRENVDQSKLEGDPELLRRAVAATRNRDEHFDRNALIKVFCALKAACAKHPGLGKELSLDLASRWENEQGLENDPDWVELTYDGIKGPHSIGADYIYRIAEAHSDGKFSRANDVWFEESVAAACAPDMAPVEPYEPLFATPEPYTPPPKPQAVLRSLARFVSEYTPLSYAVEPIIRTGSIYTVTARTGAGKTAWMNTTSLAVASGQRDILNLDVEPGRVAYLCFENPDDIRMRFMVAAHRLGIDIEALAERIMILDARAKPEGVEEALRASSEREPFRLIFVDTLAAFFDGDNINDAVQGGEFVRRMRPWTRLPGLPAVVIAAHPVKNATEQLLVPYGSGAMLNEVDGNLTLWRPPESGHVRLHWQGKLRGLEFDPLEYRFEICTAPGVLDAKGRLVRLPVMLPAVAVDAAVREKSERAEYDTSVIILKAMISEPRATQSRWGEMAGCSQSNVGKRLVKMRDEKLVEQIAGRWQVTAKGKKWAAVDVESSPDEG